MTYRLTQYTDRHGQNKCKLEKRIFGLFWWRMQRPFELAHGMTDPFDKQEAMRMIETDSRSKFQIHSQEIISTPQK